MYSKQQLIMAREAIGGAQSVIGALSVDVLTFEDQEVKDIYCSLNSAWLILNKLQEERN